MVYDVSDSKQVKAMVEKARRRFGKVDILVMEGLFIDRMDQDEEIAGKFINEDQSWETVSKHLLKEVYEKIREEAQVANDQ